MHQHKSSVTKSDKKSNSTQAKNLHSSNESNHVSAYQSPFSSGTLHLRCSSLPLLNSSSIFTPLLNTSSPDSKIFSRKTLSSCSSGLLSSSKPNCPSFKGSFTTPLLKAFFKMKKLNAQFAWIKIAITLCPNAAISIMPFAWKNGLSPKRVVRIVEQKHKKTSWEKSLGDCFFIPLQKIKLNGSS